jgi:hypothetical protein
MGIHHRDADSDRERSADGHEGRTARFLTFGRARGGALLQDAAVRGRWLPATSIRLRIKATALQPSSHLPQRPCAAPRFAEESQHGEHNVAGEGGGRCEGAVGATARVSQWRLDTSRSSRTWPRPSR